MCLHFKKIAICVFLIFISIYIAIADPIIEADIDNDLYQVGDVVKVKININENSSGFHGFYCDLQYDNSVLSLDRIEKGYMYYNINDESEFLYAVSDETTAGSIGSHVILSYLLEEEGIATYEKGTMFEIVFRVTGSGVENELYGFSFNNKSIKDTEGNEIAGAVWENSDEFMIGSDAGDAFILIRNPEENQVFYEDDVLLNVISTANTDYTIIVSNIEADYTSSPVSALTGSIEGMTIPIVYGYNVIKTVLYDNNGQELAIDEVTVLRKDDDKYIKIISPQDHALLNKDMVRVVVSSKYSNIIINGSNNGITKLDETDGDNLLFEKNIWLYQGFNTITASCTGDENEIYTDEIIIYYQKDDSVFRFVSPLSDEIIKTNVESFLTIKGEISAKYKSEGVLNTVTLKAVYEPFDESSKSITLIDDENAVIRETDINSGNMHAPYMFVNQIPIDLTGKEAGKITITAYKNKTGLIAEDIITRVIYLKKNKLEIKLIQPNIYSDDILNSLSKFEGFNNGVMPDFGDFELKDDGTITLSENDNVINTISKFTNSNVVKMLELKDKSIVAMINENSSIKIYKKEIGKILWDKISELNDIYGYDICETDLGLLIGVSNLFTNENSGLYLLKEDNSLINISIGEPISHVQFIKNYNGNIYLYGNDYSHLYTFNIYSLEENGERLSPSISSKYLFNNDYFIKQFELSSTQDIAVIRTKDDNVHFYKRTENNEYKKVILNNADFENTKYINIIPGEYSAGKYNSYLLVDYNGEFKIVMEDKYTHRLILNDIDGSVLKDNLTDQLIGINFKNDYYVFVYKIDGTDTYRIKRAQAMFNNIYPDNNFLFEYTGTAINKTNLLMLITDYYSFYIGFGNDIADEDKKVFEFTRDFVNDETMTFSYINPDIEGIKSFSFEVKSLWHESDKIEFGFSVMENGEIIEEVSYNKTALDQMLSDDMESKLFKLHDYYDEISKKYYIEIEFDDLQINNRYLSFDLTMISAGNAAPDIGNITIYKKTPVKIPKSSEQYTYLPIYGVVNDLTVKKVKIKNIEVDIQRDGSFSYLYPILSSEKEMNFNIYCKNGAGEEASVTFTVQLIDSINDIWDITINPQIEKPSTAELNEIHTDQETISLDGYYYGLKGVNAGYVLYKYDNDNTSDFNSMTIINQGVFVNEDDQLLETHDLMPSEWTAPSDYEELGSGFEYCKFTNQKLDLIPGKQILVIYVENPGGYKTEYLTENLYPLIVYNLPEDEQKIEITNLGLIKLDESDQFTENDTIFDKKINLNIYEDDNLKFKKNYIIQGEIKSLYKIYTIKVKSFNPDVVFEDGTQEIVVDVDDLGRFNVAVYIDMEENCEAKDYYFSFLPEPPFLDWMKTGLWIKAVKSFINTKIEPDFSLMDTWTESEKEMLKKPLRIKIDRYIPDGTKIKLLVNFDKVITGEFVELNPGEKIYKVVNSLIEQDLSGVKFGINRVQWWLSYDKGLISSSASDSQDMDDYVFELEGNDVYLITGIDFPVNLQTYYDNSDDLVPSLNITKDKSTELILNINNKMVWEDTIGIESYSIPDWKTINVSEGKNIVEILYKEVNKELETVEYIFYYDTKIPVISIDSFKYDVNYQYLSEITASINEVNLDRTLLIYDDESEPGGSRIEGEKEIIYVGNGIYNVRYYNLEGFSINPTSSFPVRIKVIDHSGREGESADFTGLGDITRPVIQDAVILDIPTSLIYNPSVDGKPYFYTDDGTDDFGGHIKFYNSSIGLINKDVLLDESFRVERARDIITDENVVINDGGTMVLRSGNKVILRPGFSAYNGSGMTVDLVNTETAAGYEPSTYEFNHNKESNSMSILFFFRYEYEDFFNPLYNTEQYRRIITIYEDENNSIYLGFKEGEDYLYVLNRITEDPETIYDEVLIDGSALNITFNHLSMDDWNIINLSIQELENRIQLEVNNIEPLYVNLSADYDYIIDDILKDNAAYYFGSKDGHETGHFSIARPFYINEVMDITTALELASFSEISAGMDEFPHRSYNFNDNIDDVGNSYYQLRTEGNHFSEYENSNYNEDQTHGSLKATSSHSNYLKISDNGVIFEDADNPVLVNLNLPDLNDNSGDAVRIEPNNSIYPGKYFFGNKLGNHGIKSNSWYSVSGFINPIIENGEEVPIDAKLVLRINDNEQSIKLKAGDFHLVYNHNTGLKLDDVVMYIETKTPISFNKNIIFNEGNYILPPEGLNDIDKSRAMTRYIFAPKGTVEFRYKPFNANKEGFVNYKALLVDSNYIQIGTYIESEDVPGYGCAKYYAVINGINNSTGDPLIITIETDVLVKEEWQHIQLSFSRDDSIVYFYIDGKLAGYKENITLPDPEVIGTEDNVSFGSGLDGTYFAEGYIDEINISNLYKDSTYKTDLESYNNYNPIDFEYSDDIQPELQIRMNGSSKNVDDVLYILDSKDEFYRKISTPLDFTDHGFDVNSIQSNSYILKTKMLINGHRYSNKFNFVKKNLPSFKVADFTPLIISGVESDIHFSIDFDSSYLLSTNDSTYAGAVIQLRGTSLDNEGDEEDFARSIYIIQDFISQNPRNKKWYMNTQEGIDNNEAWTEISDCTNTINIVFNNVVSVDDMEWELKSFYSYEIYNSLTDSFDSLTEEETGIVANASFSVQKEKIQFSYDGNDENQSSENIGEYEYKLKINAGSGHAAGDIFNVLSIGYVINSLTHDDVEEIRGEVNFKGTNYLDIYYDDILPLDKYGEYSCVLSLKYEGASYGTKDPITLYWEKPEKVLFEEDDRRLTINDFALLYLDKNQDTAKFYLEYSQNALEDIFYDLYVKSLVTGNEVPVKENIRLNPGLTHEIINDIQIPDGESYVYIRVYTQDAELEQQREIFINNSATAPEVFLTNTVDSLIGYNNVLFTWKGYVNSEVNTNIEYRYTLDGKVWSSYGDWEQVEFYNLEDGRYEFAVQARLGSVESTIAYAPFRVDVNKPVIDITKIHINEIKDEAGILYAVDIVADEGAVYDYTIESIVCNDVNIRFSLDGSFNIEGLPIEYDGDNEFLITVKDKVGYFTDYKIVVDNELTKILFPKTGENIVYSPMTIVGRLDEEINLDADIYIFDPLCEERDENDFTSWKKAVINPDRTFFIEDIYVNPGTSVLEAHTPLKMAIVLNNERIFTREINVWANELYRPIDMELSTHAVEGESEATKVTIDCKANVSNISSWSIDYTGDGIYDEVKMVDNAIKGKTQKWVHSYSSLGVVKPRVRVITLDGNYFSVSDEIIIHEKIKEASNVIVNNPISMTSVALPDKSSRIFVLAGLTNDYKVEVYEVGRNETYISNRLFTVSLGGTGIDNPVRIKAIDKDNIIIASNRSGKGYVYMLSANEFGNYIADTDNIVITNAEIRDIDIDRDYPGLDNTDKKIYISFIYSDEIGSVSIADGKFETDSITYNKPDVLYNADISANASISKDSSGLLVSDFYNQRIVRLSDTYKATEYFGRFGSGEKEFIMPSRIISSENRIFIYDESRKDIQVFDPLYKTQAVLYYDENDDDNYLEEGFLNDIADIGIILKEENGMQYYYALLLSRTNNKLAMIRLPQAEELRARIRNNKIVFLKDREVFTAKPVGSDLTKILSSDSIPRIEGNLDYPALAPDGKQLVFTSRIELYNGDINGSNDGSNQYAFDNLYVYDVESKVLTRIPMADINNYEIERPQFSSNGDKMIFSAKPTGSNWQLYEYYFETGGIKKLFTSDENARFPYYSPEDRFVVFTTDYDGDEEIEIVDTQNINLRINVTNNESRDSFPVWITNYPFEISNEDLNIESKIAFVSERNYNKSLYYTYIKHASEGDIRVVTKTGDETDNDPDSAAIRLTPENTEGDYPCFTGDGKKVVYEYYDGYNQLLQEYDYENDSTEIKDLPVGSVRPAGMKNKIADFDAEVTTGNDLKLTWRSYTDKEIFYTVRFRINQDDKPFVQKKIFTKDNALLTDLEMGVEYLVKVSIIENNEESASTSWKKVIIPKVAALPSYEIDEENPYLIGLHAWKPEPVEDHNWKFSWIIDNQEIATAKTSQDYAYEFATSGVKIIQLKVTNSDNTATSISEPFAVEIKTDIEPIVEHNIVTTDKTYIELDCTASRGNKIDLTSAQWVISGPGSLPVGPYTGSQIIVPLDGFSHKINVNLKIRRKAVTGQPESDILEKNYVYDLDLDDVKPVITYNADNNNERLLIFSGENSLGNIDWYRARWHVYADGIEIHREDGVSSFAYQFPEMNTEISYSVALTVPRKNDGETKTTSLIVYIEPSPIVPVITPEILTLKDGANVIGAKLILSCSGSKGSNIDFNAAKWSVPVAGTYSEQPTQIGPTAIYNLFTTGEIGQIEVSLTMMRKGGTDPITVTKLINVEAGELSEIDIRIDKKTEESTNGTAVILDILQSQGTNIEWEKTDWQITIGQTPYNIKGPAAQVNIPASGETTNINYVCSVYRYGIAQPTVKRGMVFMENDRLQPIITSELVPGETKNQYKLNVLETPGVNIDWERTTWYIYDGNENVTVKYGAEIIYAFALKDEGLGYPVYVEMFYKGNTKPFTAYVSIDVEADELVPCITWDKDYTSGDSNVFTFTAQYSLGSNIDWTQTKWTFGDSSEAQYGPIAVHRFPIADTGKEYRVSMTITRKSTNGQIETKTVYKTVKIGSDILKPIIKAQMKKNGYLVLTAEDSEGRGLLLDRSLWVFEGEGDNESLNVNEKVGDVISFSDSKTNNLSFQMIPSLSTYSAGDLASVSSGIGFTDTVINSWNENWTSYDDFKDITTAFSSSNVHTGAVCRKYVREYDTSDGSWNKDAKRSIIVTLFVYRIGPDGGMTGKSITVNIDLEAAAQMGGVCYGQ